MSDAIAQKQADGIFDEGIYNDGIFDVGVYDDLRRHVLTTETEAALQILNKAGDSEARLDMLSRLALPLARTHALDHALARTLARARDLGRAISSDPVLARALARDLAHDLEEVVRVLDENRLVMGFIITALKADRSPAAARVSSLIFPNINRLTPQVLVRDVVPILDAVVQLQESLDRLNKRPTAEVDILRITSGAVNVDMYGVKQAIEAFTDVISPKRRAIYARQKALERESERDEAEAKTLEQSHPDAETLIYEKDIILESLKQKRIETARMTAQLAQEKLAILIAVYEQYAPDLTPEQWIEEAIRMLPAFDRFFTGAEAIQVRR